MPLAKSYENHDTTAFPTYCGAACKSPNSCYYDSTKRNVIMFHSKRIQSPQIIKTITNSFNNTNIQNKIDWCYIAILT